MISQLGTSISRQENIPSVFQNCGKIPKQNHLKEDLDLVISVWVCWYLLLWECCQGRNPVDEPQGDPKQDPPTMFFGATFISFVLSY